MYSHFVHQYPIIITEDKENSIEDSAPIFLISSFPWLTFRLLIGDEF